mgnify:CR=1 FL=1
MFAVWIIVKAALYGDAVAGWPTMMVVILFVGFLLLVVFISFPGAGKGQPWQPLAWLIGLRP